MSKIEAENDKNLAWFIFAFKIKYV